MPKKKPVTEGPSKKLFKRAQALISDLAAITAESELTWDAYLRLDSILNELDNIEVESDVLAAFINRDGPNDEDFERLKAWVSAAQPDYGNGVDIAAGLDEGSGLIANRDIEENALVINIPLSHVYSATVAQGNLGDIGQDEIVSAYPALQLCLGLLLEIQGGSDSKWHAYLQSLPASFSSGLYMSQKDIENLDVSPVKDAVLRLYKNVVRQYAHVHHNLGQHSVLNPKRGGITWKSFKWATSAVLSRQNHLPTGDNDAVVAAMIPFWDLGNHANGHITTGLNKDTHSVECYSMRKYEAGEQFYIYYGDRPNQELLVFQGFVFPDNKHDRLELDLSLNPKDPIEANKRGLLAKLGIQNKGKYVVMPNGLPPITLAYLYVKTAKTIDEFTSLYAVLPNLLSSGTIPSSGFEVLNQRVAHLMVVQCRLLISQYNVNESNEWINMQKREEVKLLHRLVESMSEWIKE